jgi:dimethylargininase
VYRFSHAIVREPGANCCRGLTSATLGAADPHRLLEQHRQYVRTLISLGLEVVQLPSLPQYPDAYFVEDTAVICARAGIITNPGADQRKGEAQAMAATLSQYLPLARIKDPGRIDGGDVLQADNHFFIGLSQRTNTEGARQLGKILASSGHTWCTAEVGKGLHLKSSVNYLGRGTMVMTPEFASADLFRNYDRIVLDPGDTYAANSLRVNDHILMPAGFPRAKEKLTALGLSILELAVDQIRRMDGGLTCMSLRFNSNGVSGR